MSGKLFLVATPIGNLDDITQRAISTLKCVDYIACEDTRRTLGLLSHLGIQKPLFSYHMHNEIEMKNKITDYINSNLNVALVTDAGMPCISDPGAKLVSALRKLDIDITVIPGASAVVSAVALAGVDSPGFIFLGFLKGRSKEKEGRLRLYEFADVPLVIYSAPHDIKSDIEFIYKIYGDRKIWVIKEITKIYERVYQGYLSNIDIDNTKGEFVLIIDSSNKENAVSDKEKKMELDNLIK